MALGSPGGHHPTLRPTLQLTMPCDSVPGNSDCTELDWGSESRGLSDRGNAPPPPSPSVSLSSPQGSVSVPGASACPKLGSIRGFLLVTGPLVPVGLALILVPIPPQDP